jgi:hypothetical protein
MSYDIWLTIDTGGPEPATIWHGWNYTSNCGSMWRAAGADLAEFHDKLAGDCLPNLTAAIAKMRAEPDTFRAMNPPNGWGSYDTLLPRLDELAGAFAEHPRAIVQVWR